MFLKNCWYVAARDHELIVVEHKHLIEAQQVVIDSDPSFEPVAIASDAHRIGMA